MEGTTTRQWHRKPVVGFVGLLMIVAAAIPFLSSPAAAEHVTPVFTPGNPTCAELGDSDAELRVQPVADGTYTDGTLTVTIDVRDTGDGPVFDFTSNIDVESVFVKGGPNGNYYVYDPPVDSDTGLHAPVNDQNGKFYGLSHISFCYTPVPSTMLTVSANPTVIHSGENVTFTIAEENDGVLPLTNVSVDTDSDACDAALTGPTGDDGDGKLEPGETWTWTCTIPVSGDPATDFTLVAIGHGTAPNGKDVTWCANPAAPPTGVFCDQDERDTVTVDIIRPSTILSVSASPLVIHSGDNVTFTITETNDAPEDLTGVFVDTDSDACDLALTGPTGDDGDGKLEQGETWTWTCTIPVSGDPATDFTLVAIGHGIDATGADVTFCAAGQPTTGKFCDPDERDDVTIDIQEIFEGLTPGYWKNHLESWAATGFSPNQTLESVFDVPNSLGLDNATLLQALSFTGGSGTKGAAQTLFRAAVAALLNSAHPNIDYPRTTAQVIADVNAALASGNRATMLTLAAALDADNNLGGDINS